METESKSENIKELPIEMQKLLKNINFPVTKKALIERERKNEAIPDILREFGMLPDKEYNSAEDIAKEINRIYSGIPS